MSNQKIPAIPDFDNSITSISATLRALKMAVEIIGGMRQGEDYGSPQMFVQGNQPTIDPNNLRTGSLWIDIDTDTMNYWNGEIWKALL